MENQFEVRDLREKNKFVIDDKFLNGYAKYVGIYAVGVYSSFCRHANKEQKSWPSIKKISQELACGRNSIMTAIKRLEFWQIIAKKRLGKQCTNRYILIDKRHWKPISEVCLKDYSEVCQINFRGLRDKLHEFTTRTSNSKETQKKGNTKERISKMPSKKITTISNDGYQINFLIGKFKNVNPSYGLLFKNKTQRSAVERMLKNLGREKLNKLLDILEQTNKMKFAPVITTPLQLETKLGSLIAFVNREKENKKNNIGII